MSKSSPQLSRTRTAVDGIRAAFAYFSRFPVGSRELPKQVLHWAPAHLPLVGIVVGCATAGALVVTRPLGAQLSAAIALSVSVLLTGAIHEDGLADSADALGAAHRGKRALSIMKDSHLGTFGAVALGLSLLLRHAALAQLPTNQAGACIFVHCVARLPPVWLLTTQPTVNASPDCEGAASRLKAQATQGAVATVWGLAVCGGLLWERQWPITIVAATLAGMLLLAWGSARLCRRTVGGVTGDLLGATEQCAEIFAWLILLSGLAAT